MQTDYLQHEINKNTEQNLNWKRSFLGKYLCTDTSLIEFWQCTYAKNSAKHFGHLPCWKTFWNLLWLIGLLTNIYFIRQYQLYFPKLASKRCGKSPHFLHTCGRGTSGLPLVRMRRRMCQYEFAAMAVRWE